MFTSKGILQYIDLEQEQYKLWLLIDNEIGRYYRSLIPDKINIPRYPYHISIIRGPVPNLDKWKAYEGEEIEFKYENFVYKGQTYWWLNVSCKRLEDIRAELGLDPIGDVTLSPDGKQNWHVTIANNKGLK